MSGLKTVEMSEIFVRFDEFERKNGLFKVHIADVQIWPLIRLFVYYKLILPALMPIGAAHPDFTKSRARAGWKGFGRIKCAYHAICCRIQEWVLNNPLLSFRRSDVLLSLSPRVTRLDDGRMVRLMVDFWLPLLKSSCAVLEFKEPGKDYVASIPGNSVPVFCFGRLDYSVRRFRRSCKFKVIEDDVACFSQELSHMLADSFGITVRPSVIVKRMATAISREKVMLPMLERILKRKRVRCVVTSVGYSQRNQVLAHAAHKLGIPVVELQHGTIYRAHAAYNLSSQSSDYAPDWVLTWGRHWGSQTSNYSLRGNVSVGYPYLQYFLVLEYQQRRFRHYCL